MNSSLYISLLLYVGIVNGKQSKNLSESEKVTNMDIRKDIDTNRQEQQIFGVSLNCNQAILVCCNDNTKSQKQCFSNFKCVKLLGNSEICSKRYTEKALEYFNEYYESRNTKKIRVKRWHYVYNQSQIYQPQSQYRYPERNYYNPNQQYYPIIVNQLEKISTNVQKPQLEPPERHIYIPYFVPYHVPEPTPVVDKVPDILSRGPEIDGAVRKNGISNLDDQDGARPISFIPIKPQRTLKRLAPKVERGSVQSDVKLSRQASSSVSNKSSLNGQNSCMAAILACCLEDKNQQKNCFYSVGCMPQDIENACKSETIKAAINSYKVSFS